MSVAELHPHQQVDSRNRPHDRRRWRDVIKIHPAAELFPQLPEAELKALGEDIKAHGMKMPIIMWVPGKWRAVGATDLANICLLDGRNRLDACEAVGMSVFDKTGRRPAEFVRLEYCFEEDGQKRKTDPYEFVVSANIHRRHLATAQKRELIATLLHERPERSDRQTAELAKVHHTTVSTIRTSLEATGEISQLTHNVGKDGKSRLRRDGAKSKGAPLDKTIKMITPLQPWPGNAPSQTVGAPICYTRSPDADPDTTAAIELKAALPSVPKSRSLTPLSPRTNSAEPLGQERNLAIAAIVKHLHRDPIMFLSDVAMVMADDQARLAKVSIFNRRAALIKITHSLGLRIADDAWKGE